MKKKASILLRRKLVTLKELGSRITIYSTLKRKIGCGPFSIVPEKYRKRVENLVSLQNEKLSQIGTLIHGFSTCMRARIPFDINDVYDYNASVKGLRAVLRELQRFFHNGRPRKPPQGTTRRK